MDISKYTGYFHDGNLIDIRHFNDKIDLLLMSLVPEKAAIGNLLKETKL